MNKLVYFVLFYFLQNSAFSQAVNRDTLIQNLEIKLSQIVLEKDTIQLIYFAYEIPLSIYPYTKKNRSEETQRVKKRILDLMLDWLIKLGEFGFDYDYDINAPENNCQDINSIIIVSSTKAEADSWEKVVKTNNENCRKESDYRTYLKGLERFNCIYKRSFTRKEKRTKLMRKKILLALAEKEATNNMEIYEAFRKGMNSCKCKYF